MKPLMSLLTFTFLLNYMGVNAQEETQALKTLNDSVFEIGQKIKTPQIYFYLSGGSGIIRECEDSVKAIAIFLIRNPDLIIEIGLHTDIRGPEEMNKKNSIRQVNLIKEMLVDTFSIKPERIVAKGYGESEPLITQEEISKAETGDEKERLYQTNRRVEIKIIEN